MVARRQALNDSALQVAEAVCQNRAAGEAVIPGKAVEFGPRDRALESGQQVFLLSRILTAFSIKLYGVMLNTGRFSGYRPKVRPVNMRPILAP